MIAVTRMSRQAFYLNADCIESLEANPDTVLTLVGGEKVIVLEKPDEIIGRILDWRRRILPPRTGGAAPGFTLRSVPRPSGERE